MIRKILYILLIVPGFILLTAESCGPDAKIDREALLKAEQDTALMEIKNAFESEYLFDDRLLAYGEMAKQKLLDFTDCLGLYSDKNMDTLLKLQVKDVSYSFFYDKEVMLQISLDAPGKTGNEDHNLAGLLAELEASDYQSVDFKVFDLKTIEPLHLDSIDRYTGKLGCRFKITGHTDKDSLLLSETTNRVKMIVTRTGKKFGTEPSLLIWQVFLDEIEVSTTPRL